jgi:hypothetical protein
MKKVLKPIWTEEQQAAGERMRKAWEEFFSNAEKPKQTSESPLLGRPEEQKIATVRARHEAALMRYPNVVGVAEGFRTRRRKPTREPCLVVYVERKIPESKLKKSEILPRKIEGVPVDVFEVGKIEPLTV